MLAAAACPMANPCPSLSLTLLQISFRHFHGNKVCLALITLLFFLYIFVVLSIFPCCSSCSAFLAATLSFLSLPTTALLSTLPAYLPPTVKCDPSAAAAADAVCLRVCILCVGHLFGISVCVQGHACRSCVMNSRAVGEAQLVGEGGGQRIAHQ